MTGPHPEATPDPSPLACALAHPPAAAWQEKVKSSRATNHADRIRRSTGTVYLVRGNDGSGRAAWYYLQVRPTHKRKFEKDLKGGRLNLTDYGTILESGFGKEPPESVQQKIREQYGFNG